MSNAYDNNFTKIVISTWLKDMMMSDFKTEAHLILTSFDRKIFYPIPSVRSLDKVRILVLDHQYPWKGTKEAVDVILALKDKYPQISLIGFGVRRVNPEIMYDEYYFNLPQNKLALLYSSCDIYCCPSWYEGFGMPGLEAMACGACVVTYNNGGCLDYAHDEKTALVVENQNSKALSLALERVISDVSLRTKLQAGGLKLCANWPTWEEQAQKIKDIINI